MTTAHEDQFTPAPVEVTQGDREAAEAFWSAYCGGNDLAWRSLSAQSQRETMRAFARHRIAHSAPAGEVEPVAWLYTHPKRTSYWRTQPDEGHAEENGWTETPLYTHPAPPADVGELVEALEPFAKCCEQIADDEDDEEWAKFRLLIKDYRRARTLLAKHGGS